MSETVITNFTLPHLGCIVTFWLVTILLPGNDTLTFVDCSLRCHGGSELLSSTNFNQIDRRMLRKRSQSTDITPLVNSAVEKLQELGSNP